MNRSYITMEHLAINFIGNFHSELAAEFTKVIGAAECNILDCQMKRFGAEFSGSFLVSGTWNALAKLELQAQQIEKKYQLHLSHQRTQAKQYEGKYLPYMIYIIAPDKSGVVAEVTKFLFELGILVDSFYSEVYTARHAGTQMLSIDINICIPEAIAISEVREKFFMFCDQYNLDGILEPDKST